MKSKSPIKNPSVSATVVMTTTDNRDIAGNGPDLNASGSSGEGSVLIQCYNCWGWHHTRNNCPSLLNLTGSIR